MSRLEHAATARAVGVCGGRLGEHLQAALELAFPVAFERRGAGEADVPVALERRGAAELRGLDAVLDLGSGAAARAGTAAGLPALHLGAREDQVPAGRPVGFRLAAGGAIDARLDGAVLADPRAGGRAAPPPPDGAAVLASHGATALWWRRGRLRAAALAPAELGEREPLRDRLSPGRSLALLPLVAFLREVCAAVAWTPPAPRAAFLFDDPNLHWPTYGYLDLPALARHAREHGCHAALATVPRDARWAHPAALAALADSGGAVSLTVHGNDHDGGELGRITGIAEGVALGAQALRRVGAFERRTGRAIERVMVPPHEACSRATVAGLLRCGFEAISATLPYPWLGGPGADWLARPAGADALVGWRALERPAGLPSILRHPLAGRSEAELRLRAYLDQPLVLYGHHDDLAAGLGVLAAAQAEVDAIAPGSTWSSLRTIARGAYETRTEGATLAVRPLANRLTVDIPPGTTALRVEPPPGPPSPRLLVAGREAEFGEPVPVPPTADTLTVATGPAPLEPAEVPPPPRRPLALARRLASESRDRLTPLLPR